MTTPDGTTGGFSYTDDSVIAKVTVDVPAATLTNISQLSSAMGAMRTELEAIARAQSDWLDYLNQVPQIAERANQAFRDQITLMERMSYIQNEIGGVGGASGVAGGVGTGGGGGMAMPGGGGSPYASFGGSYGGMGGGSGYSTAAPPMYMNPFQGMMAGLGMGMNPNVMAQEAGHVASAIEEPMRAEGEMAAARGMAINPTLLGAAGALIGQIGRGKGKADSGNTGSQSSGRDADQPADPSLGGAPEDAQDPNQPAPGQTVSSKMTATVLDEVKKMVAGTRLGGLGGIGKILSTAIGGGAGGAGGGSGTPPAGPAAAGGGGWWDKIKGIGASTGVGATIGNMFSNAPLPAKIAGGVGIAATLAAASQEVGERMTRLQQLGSIEGGDWKTGLKEELHSKIIALDPRISTEEAEKSTMIPMKMGLQGNSRDQMRDLLLQNYRELGMSFEDTARLQKSIIGGSGTKLTDDAILSIRSSSEATLNVMKELAGRKGNSMSFEERKDELMAMTETLKSMGFSQQNIERSALGWQEGYGDIGSLRGKGDKIIGSAMQSKPLLATVAAQVGVTGLLPDALGPGLEEAGYDNDEITEMMARHVIKFTEHEPKRVNRIAIFKSMMNQNGVPLSFEEAAGWYDRVSGSKDHTIASNANKSIAFQAKPKSGGFSLNPLNWFGGAPASENAERVEDSFAGAGRGGDNFAPAGQQGRSLPQSGSGGQTPQVTAHGQVSGTVTIVVDQQGRVTAPQAIQLTGQQRAVFAGSGGAQLNNAPPGDPVTSAFPGGG